MNKLGFRIAIFLLAGVLSVWAQQGGGGGGNTGGGGGGGNTGGGGGGNTGGGNTGGNSPGNIGGQQRDPFGQQQQQQMPEMRRPLFLSGQVMMEEGGPPPEPVTIERVCNGSPVPEDYTDSKGRFSFEVGGDPSMAMADASISSSNIGGPGFGRGGGINTGFGNTGGFGSGGAGSMGMVDLTGCELRASLPGYQSDLVPLGRRSVFDNPNVGVIILHRLGGVQGVSISATTLAAPKDSKKAYEKGLKEMRGNKPNFEKASKELEKAVAGYPQYAAAWSALGHARLAMENKAGAREAFEKSMEADPKYLIPYVPLLRLDMQENKWEDAAELSDSFLKLNPTVAEARYHNAVAHFQMGNYDQAAESAKKLQEGDQAKEYPGTHHLMGLIHSKKGDFNSAATEFRSFLVARPTSPVSSELQRQINEWEVLGVIKKQETASAAPPPPKN